MISGFCFCYNNEVRGDILRVWTRQSAKAWEELRNKGVLRIKKSHVKKKYGDCSDTFMLCYDWLVDEASKHLEKPQGVEGPIWLALRSDFMPCPAENTVVIELEMERDKLLVLDMGKWDYILNYWHIPKDEKDRRSFRRALDEKGVTNQSQVMMTQFHPVLKREMKKSWSRLFDENIRVSENDQAICWEIKMEWVVMVDGKNPRDL